MGMKREVERKWKRSEREAFQKGWGVVEWEGKR